MEGWKQQQKTAQLDGDKRFVACIQLEATRQEKVRK